MNNRNSESKYVVLDELESEEDKEYHTKKRCLTCKELFYKVYFKIDDMKFWFEVNYKDDIVNFIKKNIPLITLGFVLILYFIASLIFSLS